MKCSPGVISGPVRSQLAARCSRPGEVRQPLGCAWHVRPSPLQSQAAQAHSGVPAALPPALDTQGQLSQHTSGAARRRQAGLCRAVPVAAAAAGPSSSIMQVAAVVVGWLVIAGSCIRSLPQILRILKNKSVEGLSLTSFATEACTLTVQCAYNLTYGYAFSTYGDVVMCQLQTVAVIGLMFMYGNIATTTKWSVTLGFLALCVFMFSGLCSLPLLNVLQASTVVMLALGGRLPQIVMNFKRGNSGELSLLTVGLSLTGNIMRVFTTLQLVKDGLVLASAASQGVLNGILFYQCVSTALRSREVKVQPA